MEVYVIGWLLFGAGAAVLLEVFDDEDDDDTPNAPGENEEEFVAPEGTDGSDLLQGTPANDRIAAGDGDDSVAGGEGDDTLLGQDGDDLLSGEAGNDSLDGSNGSDTLVGGDGQDVLFGRLGNDLLLGGAGDDELWGAQGEDLLIGDLGADTMIGGVGDDVLVGVSIDLDTAPEDVVSPGEAEEEEIDLTVPPVLGDDTDDGDTMSGGFGDDTFLVGSNDVVDGGEGDDAFILGDWIAEDGPAQITDYEPGADVITISYDSAIENPVVDVTANEDGDAIVSLNEQVLATITGAGETLTAEDIVLIAREQMMAAG
jgi:Ca2+-binding RTX toxin-like protein